MLPIKLWPINVFYIFRFTDTVLKYKVFIIIIFILYFIYNLAI